MKKTSDALLSLSAGMLFHDKETDTEYSILYLDASDDYAVLCQRNITKLNVFSYSIKELVHDFASGKYQPVQVKKHVVSVEKLAPSIQEKYERDKHIISDFEEHYGPDYSGLLKRSDDYMSRILPNKYGIAAKNLYRLIRRYLQSGKDITSLINGRAFGNSSGQKNNKKKIGRPADDGPQGVTLTPDIIEAFDRALEDYKAGRKNTFTKVYDTMRATDFSDQVEEDGQIRYIPFPISETPTYQQFYYYAHKKISAEDQKTIKTSRAEYRNNNRELRSSVMKAAVGPGVITEMDELECDLEIVDSATRTENVGRPILYCLIDVYSRLIMAIGVSFENNSVKGFTQCLMWLTDNKFKLAEQYGVHIDQSMWPSMYLPSIIRSDRGAEYMANEIGRILRELGITLEPVPAETGSLKPVVEQSFHQLHVRINPHTENKGLITKRHDSNHRTHAKLTIQEFTRIVINQAVRHNTSVIKKYKLTAKMIADNVLAIPVDLWQYGCKNGLEPRKIQNIEQFAWTLMSPESGKISRAGLVVNNLVYLPKDDYYVENKMQAAGDKKVDFPFDIRMDERIVDRVYYLKNGMLKFCSLNLDLCEDYAGMMLEDARALVKASRKQIKKAAKASDGIGLYTTMVTQAIVDDATKKTNAAQRKAFQEDPSRRSGLDTAAVRANRAKERRNTMNEHYIESTVLGNDEYGTKQIPDKTENVIPHVSSHTEKTTETKETNPFASFFDGDDVDWDEAIQEEQKGE